jgi:hypothetical protein
VRVVLGILRSLPFGLAFHVRILVASEVPRTRLIEVLAGIIGKPDDQAIKAPNLNIVAVNKPDCLISSFMIIGALDYFQRPRNVVLAIDKIDAICGHGRSQSQAGVLPNSQPPTPDQRSLSVILLCGIVASETLVSKDVLVKRSVPKSTREWCCRGRSWLSNGVVPMCARATKTKRLA